MPQIIDETKANELETGEPVPGFGLKFTWHKHYWAAIFDRQCELIRRDIARARAEDRLIIYLSCPISARGGGDHTTNVEIAKAAERHILQEWGDGFWILNPAQYQLESKEGLGLIEQHAQALDIDLAELRKKTTRRAPSGGDYMRMWTKVLVEDAMFRYKSASVRSAGQPEPAPNPRLLNTGRHFDGYYFLGPDDIARFFSASAGDSLTESIGVHFARKFSTDPDFRDAYSIDEIAWGADVAADPRFAVDGGKRQLQLREAWEELRRQYLRYYALRAGTNFSLGSHDEWEILRLINQKRCAATATGDGNVGVAEQLGAFFDGRQINLASYDSRVSPGYAK